jgi:hypothetical protein
VIPTRHVAPDVLLRTFHQIFGASRSAGFAVSPNFPRITMPRTGTLARWNGMFHLEYD